MRLRQCSTRDAEFSHRIASQSEGHAHEPYVKARRPTPYSSMMTDGVIAPEAARLSAALAPALRKGFLTALPSTQLSFRPGASPTLRWRSSRSTAASLQIRGRTLVSESRSIIAMPHSAALRVSLKGTAPMGRDALGADPHCELARVLRALCTQHESSTQRIRSRGDARKRPRCRRSTHDSGARA